MTLDRHAVFDSAAHTSCRLEKEAIAVELVPSHLAFLPYPHKICHIVLQYFNHDQQAIRETFEADSPTRRYWS